MRFIVTLGDVLFIIWMLLALILTLIVLIIYGIEKIVKRKSEKCKIDRK